MIKGGNIEDLDFQYDKKWVDPNDTPISLRMNDGDIVYVYNKNKVSQHSLTPKVRLKIEGFSGEMRAHIPVNQALKYLMRLYCVEKVNFSFKKIIFGILFFNFFWKGHIY